MSSHEHQDGNITKFAPTAILSFVVVFLFLLLMSTCHGPFKPADSHAEQTEHTPAAEGHGEHH